MTLFFIFLSVLLVQQSLAGQTSVEQFEHAKVSVNSISLNYQIAGKGKPVLLLHGRPQHWLGDENPNFSLLG